MTSVGLSLLKYKLDVGLKQGHDLSEIISIISELFSWDVTQLSQVLRVFADLEEVKSQQTRELLKL